MGVAMLIFPLICLIAVIAVVLIVVLAVSGRKNGDDDAVLNYSGLTDDVPKSYFDGSTLGYIGWKILTSLITCITFGIAYPWAMCMMQRRETNHTVINGRRLKFTGHGAQLFG